MGVRCQRSANGKNKNPFYPKQLKAVLGKLKSMDLAPSETTATKVSQGRQRRRGAEIEAQSSKLSRCHLTRFRVIIGR